jgi:hypothetical protein
VEYSVDVVKSIWFIVVFSSEISLLIFLVWMTYLFVIVWYWSYLLLLCQGLSVFLCAVVFSFWIWLCLCLCIYVYIWYLLIDWFLYHNEVTFKSLLSDFSLKSFFRYYYKYSCLLSVSILSLKVYFCLCHLGASGIVNNWSDLGF